MTDAQLQATVLKLLGTIAPDVELDSVNPEVPFRDQFDFDSMDFLNFAIALHKEFKVEIPEADYARLATLNGCVGYLQEVLAGRS
ncbi:MAG TPA: acyl carrier protein [Candidatus Competibacteraceae bacterium]|nr:acyl carrier protein [Candidatus Competibacteraceae bacterium]